MLGNGTGGFAPVNTSSSGLNIDGEVRDISIVEQPNENPLIIFARNNAAVLSYRKTTK